MAQLSSRFAHVKLCNWCNDKITELLRKTLSNQQLLVQLLVPNPNPNKHILGEDVTRLIGTHDQTKLINDCNGNLENTMPVQYVDITSDMTK